MVSRTELLLVGLLIAGVLLGGCGGSDEASGPVRTPPPGATVRVASPVSTLTSVCATALAAPTVDPAQAARAGSARATSAALLVAATATACASGGGQ